MEKWDTTLSYIIISSIEYFISDVGVHTKTKTFSFIRNIVFVFSAQALVVVWVLYCVTLFNYFTTGHNTILIIQHKHPSRKMIRLYYYYILMQWLHSTRLNIKNTFLKKFLKFSCFFNIWVSGILFNNQMDDFSIPGSPNFFGLAPSPLNYPEVRYDLIML